MPTPHNKALKGEIANIVLMPGDPLRAKYIAEKYLQDYKLVNDIRGMYAYTGFYKGKRISVMGHGMGMPSIGIYSYELFKFYDVDIIIRLGSCGSHNQNFKVGDTVITNKVQTLSNISIEMFNEDIKELSVHDDINNIILETASNMNIELKKCCVTTLDVFDLYYPEIIDNYNIEVAEMEAFGLYAVAKLLNKKCACLLTVVDSPFESTKVSATDREKKLDSMIEVALESTLNL